MTIEYLKKAEEKPAEDLSKVVSVVQEVLEKVRKEGETAVRYYSEKFDAWNPESFRLTDKEISDAEGKVPSQLKNDILFLREQVKKFAEAQRRTLTDFKIETASGTFIGQRYLPIESVGVYIPGGRYTLIASSQMSIVPAKVAGVKRIVACTPVREGKLNPAVVYAIHAAGADEIYAIGGVQAIAAMTFGLEGLLKPVDFIAGPGNKYVVEAKREVFGRVGIDLLAGPTEIGIIADDSADPEILAADILAQAEHDPDSPQYLIAMSKELAKQVMNQIEIQLAKIPTAEVAGVAWHTNGEVVVVSSPEEAVELSDRYAPEHLEVQARELDWFFDHLSNYGTLFLGEESTVAYSDKAIGTNHILPTGRAARFTGGLWVGKFMKNVTYQTLNTQGSLWIGPYAARIAHAEGMFAHEKSVDTRMEKYSSQA